VPKRDEAPIGAPCWVDLFTSDPDRSRAFYGELFGWTAEEPNQEFGGYFNFTKDGVRIAGGMRNDGSSGQPDGWSVYLATDDTEKTVAGATAHGGQVVVPPMAVGDLGTMAVVSDPGGAVIGMWQPGAHRGFGLLSEPGAPSWFELHTRDYEASVDFYRTVFRWETSVVGDAPEFSYTTLTIGDDMFAGIMDAQNFLPEGVPAHWSVYYATDDADASLDLVRKLGGTVVTDAEDTPYGRLATASDPTGAVFKLRQAPAS
jgi:predicted enzyme related to lactoylglutathione lyase